MARILRPCVSASSEMRSATSLSIVIDRSPVVDLGVNLGIVLAVDLKVGLGVGPGLTPVSPWVPFWVVSVVIAGHRMLYPCTCKGGNGYCQQARVCVTLLSTPNGKGTARHA
jgi:hypothetical protein